jgi:hypothetical protein
MITRGYDIDGVITHGIVPFGPRAFIVTGRSYEQSKRTIEMLHEKRIFNPVYFCPVSQSDISKTVSAVWKLKMINELGIDEFYEDDQFQIGIISRQCSVKIHLVVDGKAVN